MIFGPDVEELTYISFFRLRITKVIFFQIDGLKAIVNYMSFLSRSPYTRKGSIDPSGQPMDSKFQTKGHLMKAMKNLIDIDPNLLHSDEMRQSLPNEMITILETDTSQCG